MKTTVPYVLICLFLAYTSFLFGQCSCVEKPTEFKYAKPIICQNFEQYANDDLHANGNPLWIPWPGYEKYPIKLYPSPTGGDNKKSLYVENNGFADPSVLLNLGNLTKGQFRLSWQMYISKGRTAHYNIRHNEKVTGGVHEWAFKVAFGGNGVGTVNLYNDTPVSYFPFPSGAWINIVHIIDLSEDRIELWINDEFVDAWKFSLGFKANSLDNNKKLGSVNFYGIPNASFYVDNICLWENRIPAIGLIEDNPVCIKNGKEFQNAESAKLYGFYSETEFNNNGSCPDLCSYGGINIYNSEDAVQALSDIAKVSVNSNDILPNRLINNSCLNNVFAERSRKQIKGKIYKFTPRKKPVIEVSLITETNEKNNFEVIVLNCQTEVCAHLVQKNDSLGKYKFEAEVNMPHIVVILAESEKKFSLKISEGDFMNLCGDVCICGIEDTYELRGKQASLQNQKVSALSAVKLFGNSLTKPYTGGEKFYSFSLADPGFVDLTILSPNMGYVCYLFDNNCSGNLLALANNADNGGSLSIHKYLEPGVYKIVVDQLVLNPSFFFDFSFNVSDTVSSFSTSTPCQMRTTNSHTITIRNNPLTLDGIPLTLNDRIYVVNESNKVDRERDALNWNSNEIQFNLYPATSETDKCGYKEGELISFVIRRGDKIYKVRPIYQSLDGELITASDRFKPNGKSLILGFISRLEVSSLSIGSIPNISPSQKDFLIDVVSNSNWKIRPKNGQFSGWYQFSPASAFGNSDVSFKISPNPSSEPREETLIISDDDGFYKTFTLYQAGCTGSIVNAGIDKNICPGQNVTLTATGNGIITWHTPGTISNPNFTTTLTNNTRTFTAYSTINGCTASDQVTVNVIKPNANAGPDQSICRGQGVVLTASGGDTYRWSTNHTSSSITLNPDVTKTYTVTVTQNSCTATDEVIVTVRPLPTINAGADQSICKGQNAVLTAFGGSSYKWSTNATTPAITVTPSATQTYSVTGTLDGCESSDLVVVTVKPLPIVNAGPDLSICAGQSAVLNVSGGTSYRWSTNATTASLTVTPSETRNYTVTVSQNGCEAVDTILVTVKPLPKANAGPDLSICDGQTAILNAKGGSSYKWSTNATTASISLTPLATQVFTVTVTQDACENTDDVLVEVKALPIANAGADISICAGQNAILNASGGTSYRWNNNATTPSLTVAPPETIKYTVTVTQNGCEDSDDVVVTVKKAPIANAGLDQIICEGQSAILNATGGGSYKWSTNASTSSITVNPLSTQIFKVSVTQDGCTDIDEVIINVKPLPSANAGPDQSVCEGQNVTLTASGGSTYKWSTNATTTSISFTPLATQVFIVTVTQNGCERPDTVLVSVKRPPSANAGPDLSICAGQTAVLNASGGSIYRWSTAASTPSISVNPTKTQRYTVTVTQNSCEATDEVEVTVKPNPVANAGLDQSICIDQSATLNATGGGSYKWSTSASTASITVAPFATQIFSVTVTQDGCTDTDDVLVTVKPKPSANAGPDQSICAKQSVVLKASGGNTYKWSNNATTASITISPQATQIFTVTVTQNECEAIDAVTITVNPNPSIKKDSSQFKAGPNSFIAVSVTGGKVPYQYQWFRNDTLSSTQEDLVGLKTGIYKLTVQDANGCNAGFGPELYIITSLLDLNGFLDLKIYPNPTQGQLQIEGKLSKKETVQVRILEATGKYIWKSDIITANEFLYTPDLSSLAKGIYIIQLDVSGELVYRKFILH